MSGKSGELQPGLPGLSAELLLVIFRMATDSSNSLAYPQCCLDYLGLARLLNPPSYYNQSLITKLSLVKVCRQWNALATPFLYEHVQLTTSDQLNSIFNPNRNILGSKEDTVGLGHSIKRLDLLLESHPDWGRNEEDSTSYAPAPQLCKLAPNLSTLVTMNHPKSFPRFDIFAPHLQYLLWVDPSRRLVSQWTPFMSHHPHLTSAWIGSMPPADFMYSHPSPIRPPVCQVWRATRELVCFNKSQTNTYASEFPSHSFPNLQKVQFLYTPRPSALGQFLAVHGASITTLNLSYSISHSPFRLPDLLSEVHQDQCPLLKELWLTLTDAFRYSPDPQWLSPLSYHAITGVCMPAITVIGFHFIEPPLRDAADKWESIFNVILSWEDSGCFPSLQAVRFLYNFEIGYVQKTCPDKITGFLERCRERGVNVLDESGQVVRLTSTEYLDCPQ